LSAEVISTLNSETTRIPNSSSCILRVLRLSQKLDINERSVSHEADSHHISDRRTADSEQHSYFLLSLLKMVLWGKQSGELQVHKTNYLKAAELKNTPSTGASG